VDRGRAKKEHFLKARVHRQGDACQKVRERKREKERGTTDREGREREIRKGEHLVTCK